MYSRDRIGLAEDLILMPGEGGEVTSVTPYSGSVNVLTPSGGYDWFQTQVSVPTSQPAASSFSWGDFLTPVANVLKTGADIFSKVYPAIKGTGYPSPYPQTPGNSIPPGYRYDPTTGRLVPMQTQAGIGSLTSSPYFLPIVLGLGAFLIMKKR